MKLKSLATGLLVTTGLGIGGYYLYENNSGFKMNVDKLISNFYSEDSIISVDTFRLESAKDSLIYSEKKTSTKVVSKKIPPFSQYKKLDDYAKNAPSNVATDITTLANYLIKPAQNEMEKTRLLFSWIAFHVKYDDVGYNTNKYGDLTAEGVLKSRKAVCEGFANLFKSLASSAGLKAEKISGYAKGYAYKTGQDFTKANHAWNAINIDGKWKLFDVTWAQGYGDTKNGKLVSKVQFDDYWFDTHPKEFIFTHFPEVQTWQLLTSQLTLKQYETLPYVGKEFFKYGFKNDYTLKNALGGVILQFVEAYALKFPLKVISVPYKKEIEENKVYDLKIESNYAEQIALINNGDWIYFSKEGNIFTLQAKPKKGEMSISVKNNPQDKDFETVLQYDVK